jgi:hypothetical protein
VPAASPSARLEGESLEGLLRVNSGGEPAIPGGGSALLFMDVVVKIAPKRFAFYAHMQPGSLRVKEGDRVRKGQILGLLGNTGNTDAPHLHFHIMDGPSPLQSNGLPVRALALHGARACHRRGGAAER